MGFGPERLDVYRAAIGYVGGAYRFCEELKGYTLQDEAGDSLVSRNDSDTDSDPDPDKNKTGRWPTIKGVLLRSEAEPATTPLVEQARRRPGDPASLWPLCCGGSHRPRDQGGSFVSLSDHYPQPKTERMVTAGVIGEATANVWIQVQES